MTRTIIALVILLALLLFVGWGIIRIYFAAREEAREERKSIAAHEKEMRELDNDTEIFVHEERTDV